MEIRRVVLNLVENVTDVVVGFTTDHPFRGPMTSEDTVRVVGAAGFLVTGGMDTLSAAVSDVISQALAKPGVKGEPVVLPQVNIPAPATPAAAGATALALAP